MLKSAINFNVFFILVISIIFLVIGITSKNYHVLKALKFAVVCYFVLNVISYIVSCGDFVDTGWNALVFMPVAAISAILFIISFIVINKHLKTMEPTEEAGNVLFYKLSVLVPILIFIIPYIYELIILNTCDLLLEYNYQNGIVISNDHYYALTDTSFKEITLQNNLFSKNEGDKVQEERFDVLYDTKPVVSIRDEHFDKKVIKNETIEAIAKDAKEKCPNAVSASVLSLKSGKYNIITLLDQDGHGTVLGEYYYNGTNFVKQVHTSGSLKSVKYYSK